MAHLTINNIGAIKAIDIDLNRFNIFIGPQSSGKSTIAKIVSFCQWLEKDCIVGHQTKYVDDAFVNDRLIDYHNIRGYLKEDSSFHFVGSTLNIRFADGRITLIPTNGLNETKVSKNAYIPAERTVISIPGIFSTKMPENYLASFLDDWQHIRSKFGVGDKVDILNLGESYYFDKNANADMLSMPEGGRLYLSQASSGLQSVTPLCVYVAYITEWIYSHQEDRSSDERKRIWESAVAKSISERRQVASDDLNGAISNIETRNLDLEPIVEKIKKWSEILSTPSFSNIVIEEPELNLFPRTQANLIYYILSNVDHTRDNMVITTHSPYILYAINNCILSILVKDNLTEEDWMDLDIPESATLDGKDISVWELRDGHIVNDKGIQDATIQDRNGLIRGNYFDRVMHNIMADFNFLLNYK